MDVPANAVLTVPAQIDRLLNGDAGERYYAAWWLGFPEAQGAVPALLIALTDDRDRTEAGGYPLRRAAAQALGKIGDPSSVPGLLAALTSEDPHVTAKVARALGCMVRHHPDVQATVEPPLLTWLHAHHPLAVPTPTDFSRTPLDALEAVIETLGLMRSQLAVEVITPFLQSPALRLQGGAARALFQITGDIRYAEQLIMALQHDNIQIRRATMFDLGATGYLPGAEAIASAPIETNLKLMALKTLADTYFEQSSDLTPAVEELLAIFDRLL